MTTETQSEYPVISRRAAAIDMLAIALFWCFSIIIVNPVGNFPLNDDWSLGLTVNHLVENGDFRPTGWTSMPLITQAIWGAIFCLPAGFSFNALRLSTLTLSLIGILGFYLLFKEMHKPRWLAVTASLTLAFSPIFFLLSNTFMTDVPFTSITILASVYFIRNLKNDSDLSLVLATLFAIAATLTRQLAISIPMAFAISFLLSRGFSLRNIVRAITPATICILALLSFQQWLTATGRLPVLYNVKSAEILKALTNPGTILIFAENIYLALCYMGLFLLPILLLVFWADFRSHGKRVLTLLAFSTIMIAAGAILTALIYGKNVVLMPRDSSLGIGNVIIKSGAGPLTMPDSTINTILLPDSFWMTVTAISLIGAIFLLTAIIQNSLKLMPKLWPQKMDYSESVTFFLLLNTMIYFMPILLTGFYDRYLVPVIPFFAAGLLNISSYKERIPVKVVFITAITFILVFAIFSVCLTRDYLTWNRTRWDALNYLMKSSNVKVENIDGGFEFNGWYLYDPQYRIIPNKSWWWVKDDTYMAGFGNIPGYTAMAEYNYDLWLPPFAGKIVVQKRNF